MTDERLTDQLAACVMGWKRGRDRYVKAGRGWIPSWRFRPLVVLADAFHLLDRAAHHYTLTRNGHTITVKVRTDSGQGIASGEQMARTMTLAVARALGLEVDR